MLAYMSFSVSASRANNLEWKEEIAIKMSKQMSFIGVFFNFEKKNQYEYRQTKDYLTEFIELFKNKPEIRKIKSELYKNMQ